MRPGELVADRFEIQGVAGSGGHGTVYLACDAQTGTHVAVKVMNAQEAGSAEPDARFQREAVILAQLAHPGIVRYVAHGVADGDRAYIAMEWLEGESLLSYLKNRAISVEETIRLGRRVADALRVAHDQGVVHRDLKPSNLFLVARDVDRVKVLDFGIARLVRPGHSVTLTGTVLGTPGYIAPEQAHGQRDVDARADVFALGCVLYRCLTGKPPFVGEHVLSTLLKIVLERAPRVSETLPSVPDELDDLVARMMSKAPSDRPAHGGAVADALAGLRFQSSVRPAPDSTNRGSLTSTEREVLFLLVGRLWVGAEEADAPGSRDMHEHALREIAQRHHARLEMLADGSVFLTLASAGAATDQASRGARCALALRRLLGPLPLALVAGQGLAAGNLPIGEVIDRGVRLLNTSSAGTWLEPVLRIDDVVAGLLDARFDVSADDTGLSLKGERDAEVTRTLLGKETSCVGRDRELVTLDAFVGECVSEGISRSVLVTGPAGCGKSRLRYEIVRRIRERRNLEVWIGRGDPMNAGSPFALLSEILRRVTGALEVEPPAVRQHKLLSRIGRRVSGEKLTRIAQLVGDLMGPARADRREFPSHDAWQASEEARSAFEEWMRAECSAAPLILVIDDLQWGDLPTIRFLGKAQAALHDRPFLLLAFARPEVHDLFPEIRTELDAQELRIEELSRRSCERLVREVLGATVPAETVAMVVDKAAGNAFYLEELIRAVADGRSAELPETVLAMVQTRLLRLEPDARRVLRAASVFGHVFWRGGVEALLGADAVVGQWLDALVQREIIARRNSGKFPSELEFVFCNTALREAAYSMLTEADRILGHRLAGDWLERRGEQDALVLAEHFERGDESIRAVAAYRRATAMALDKNHPEAAITRAQRGIALAACSRIRVEHGDADATIPTSSPPLVGELRLLQAEAHRSLGQFAEAEASAVAALRALDRFSSAWHVAVGEAVLAAGKLTHVAKIEELAQELLVVPSHDQSAQFVVALAKTTATLFFVGRHDLTEPLFRRMDVLAAEGGQQDAAAAAWIHRARAVRALERGDTDEYLRLMESTARSIERAGDLASERGKLLPLLQPLLGIGGFRDPEARRGGRREHTYDAPMAHCLSVSALHSRTVDQVVELVRTYAGLHGVTAEVLRRGEPDPARDALIFDARESWTVVLWPAYFNVHDLAASLAISTAGGALVSTVHVYDEAYWVHVLFDAGTILDRFASVPAAFSGEDEKHIARKWWGDARVLASRMGKNHAMLEPYLVHLDPDADIPPTKAFPDDEHPLTDIWVFIDFWRKLGVTYPDPLSGFAARVRFGADFGQKLPTGDEEL